VKHFNYEHIYFLPKYNNANKNIDERPEMIIKSNQPLIRSLRLSQERIVDGLRFKTYKDTCRYFGHMNLFLPYIQKHN